MVLQWKESIITMGSRFIAPVHYMNCRSYAWQKSNEIVSTVLWSREQGTFVCIINDYNYMYNLTVTQDETETQISNESSYVLVDNIWMVEHAFSTGWKFKHTLNSPYVHVAHALIRRNSMMLLRDSWNAIFLNFEFCQWSCYWFNVYTAFGYLALGN